MEKTNSKNSKSAKNPEQFIELSTLELESTAKFLEDETETKRQIEVLKETTRNNINLHKNKVVTVLTSIILVVLIYLAVNRDFEKDKLTNEIYKDRNIELKEKIIMIQELNNNYFKDITGLFLPTFTLAIGYFLGTKEKH